jgi:hypothetical protein
VVRCPSRQGVRHRPVAGRCVIHGGCGVLRVDADPDRPRGRRVEPRSNLAERRRAARCALIGEEVMASSAIGGIPVLGHLPCATDHGPARSLPRMALSLAGGRRPVFSPSHTAYSMWIGRRPSGRFRSLE